MKERPKNGKPRPPKPVVQVALAHDLAKIEAIERQARFLEAKKPRTFPAVGAVCVCQEHKGRSAEDCRRTIRGKAGTIVPCSCWCHLAASKPRPCSCSGATSHECRHRPRGIPKLDWIPKCPCACHQERTG